MVREYKLFILNCYILYEKSENSKKPKLISSTQLLITIIILENYNSYNKLTIVNYNVSK